MKKISLKSNDNRLAMDGAINSGAASKGVSILGFSLLIGAALTLPGNAFATSVSASETGGFTITSPDERFSFSFGNRAQLRYDYIDADDGDDVSNFRLRRLRPAVSGHVYTPDLTYIIVPDIANSFTMLVAAMNYRFTDQFQVRVGQAKTPYGYERYTSSGRLSFVDRSLTTTFDHAFPIGITAHGNIPEAAGLTYEVGVFNQGERNQNNFDNRHRLVGRLDFEPFGSMHPRRLSYPDAPIDDMRFRVGVAGSISRTDLNLIDDRGSLSGFEETALLSLQAQPGFVRGDLRHVDIWAINPDFGVQIQQFSLHGELHYMEADPNGTGDRKAEILGWMAQAGLFLTPEWQVVARYSEVDEDNFDAPGVDAQEWRVGLNWFYDGHGLKVQADIGQFEDKVTRDEDTEFRLQAQITF
ncbi:OprO/OprP family phosphate-selective porin [Methylonatrum kenyense]|uniref:porin n=1 Tax=Methylonatrum kenyense TaxID=455253 RepID=UPI0020BDD194|nr:porin [Methylonatrum kenyense]MCK8516517.1 OprO/OprP family phosphate-selective porin [Methylonatrum kenyense]